MLPSHEVFVTEEIAPSAALVAVKGKLRGRHARQLEDHLSAIKVFGTNRVVLDLQELTSIDSVGTFALESAIDQGLRLHLVVRPSFQFDEFFNSRALIRRGLRVHRSLDDALRRVRQIVDSGMPELVLA